MLQEETHSPPTREQIDEESRRIRRLRIVVALALQIIAQGGMSFKDACDLASATRRVALQLFPGKESAYDLLYRPKFHRLISSVYRLN